MGQESDWLMRQINDLASGLGYIISRGKGGSETEIIFPQKEEEKLPHKDKLQRLINNHQYSQAAERLLQLRYAMEKEDFLRLGVWFYQTLNHFDDQELTKGNYSRQEIVSGLTKLKDMDFK
ncbi:DUF6483 family protein (plasmid) [Ligilactobacillus acidipiscis]|uniref:DUF6483 family protein n=1 Tax=Ligilactobacillus acidipiscis TaxID=89059 RepID=UPI00386E728C